MSTLTAQEFIRLSFEAIQERDPDLEDIEQRFVDRWGADQQAVRRETLTAVLAALGRGVSPSYVVAIVAEEFGIDLAAGEAS
jgi:phosphoenolpyruvate-protein kinase (PTS system EI component)